MPTRFLLIDDHALIREGLALALARVTEQLEVLEAASCEAAASLLAAHPDVDLVLLDMQLPGRARLDALREVQRLVPRTPIIVVSSEAPRELVQAALAAGARGYVPKSVPTDVLLAAVRLVFAGGVYVPTAMLAPPAPLEGELALTARQERVLAELADGAGTDEIAARLGIAEVTVRVHVSAIVRALRVDSREAAARTPLAQRLLAARRPPA